MKNNISNFFGSLIYFVNYQQNTTTLRSGKLTIGPVFVTLTLKPFLPTQVLIRFSGPQDTSVFVKADMNS